MLGKEGGGRRERETGKSSMKWHWCGKEMSISGCLEGFLEEAVPHWHTPALKDRPEIFQSEIGIVLEKVRSSHNLLL